MSTLPNFGVPLGGGAGRGGIIQPKIKYKFRVRVVNFGPVGGGLDLTQQVAKINLPDIDHKRIDVHSYNSIGYYAAKPEFAEISLTVRDDVTNLTTALVGNQVQRQMDHFEQTSDLAGVNYKFLMYIETLDGGNEAVLETWTCEGCFLTKVKYGELDYSSSEKREIEMSISCDNITLGNGLWSLNPGYIAGTNLG